jgi:hypothetical protein
VVSPVRRKKAPECVTGPIWADRTGVTRRAKDRRLGLC